MSVARCPILSRCCSIVTPGVSIGTMNADMPRCPFDDVGLREDDRPVGVARVRDEGLRAVQDVLVAAALGRRLQARDVGAGLRLGEAERAEDRRLEQRRQPRRLLLVGAGDDHGAGAEAVRAERGADAGAAPVELLADEHPVERVQAEPAVLRRDVQVHQADLVRLRDHVGRVLHVRRRTRRPSGGSPSSRTRAPARASSFCSSVRANETPPATGRLDRGHARSLEVD